MGIYITRNYICEQCKKNQHIGSGSNALPDNWILLTKRGEGFKNEQAVLCSIDCAMSWLADWADEIEQKWGWAQ